MAVVELADRHFTIDAREASFQTQPKRRGSNLSTKASKCFKWPHKFLSAQELAKAGFFFCPTPTNPDNAVCFLCHKSLDGWEKGDDPLEEHLKHSPDCGWAIVASIEAKHEEMSVEYPNSTRMVDARRATFADKWPHEGKKAWKCKVKQMVDAGWKYTPTEEYDDMTTCTYCDLALDGWEPADKPMEEHLARSPDCPFFALIDSYKEKAPKTKKVRQSKTSRMSTQSSFTIASEAPSFLEPAEDGDSILTTATTATSQGRKLTKARKPAAAKGKKSKAKKEEPTEVIEEPELDDDSELAPKNRGKKRKSDDAMDISEISVKAPAPKRRTTRTRGSTAVDSSLIDTTMTEDTTEAPAAKKKRGRPSVRKSSRKVSTASVASTAALSEAMPDDDELEKELLADLERPLTDDENNSLIVAPIKKGTRLSKTSQSSHRLFGGESTVDDEAAIDAELEAMEADAILPKPPKGKSAKPKQPRKVSAKQQAAAKKAAEAEMKNDDDDVAGQAEDPTIPPAEKEVPAPVAPVEQETEIYNDEEELPSELPDTSVHRVSMPEAQEIITMAPSPSPARTRTPATANSRVSKTRTPRQSSLVQPTEEATPQSPASSDAENQPPSSKPSATAKKATFSTPGQSSKVPLATSTPQASPSKRNVIAGLQSEHPWTAVDLDVVFMKSPLDENAPRRGPGLLEEALSKAKTGHLTSPEKRMSVEEWIQYNATTAEEKFKAECERMVGAFESEGGRAMRSLEGIVVENS